MAFVEAWEVAKRAIEAYTGLSPATFFTVLAVAVALYHTVAGFLAPPPPPPPRSREVEPLAPPVQLGEVTEEELRAYDGSDSKKPLLMAIKGQIYDVTQSRMFYGPGGPYALFAGKDASRALAKMSFEPVDLTGDISGLGPFELDALQDWEYKFMSKYVKVGTIKKTLPATDEAVPTTDRTDDGTTSEVTEKSTGITDGTDRQVEHSAETKEDDPVETRANREHDEEPKQDGRFGHGEAELKENDSSELKEVGAGEGTKE
ncbi:membrane steroid-binding protein [Musa troglodytarum]|uniref:Membrane steroid-binding protein n=1 Tax=Musa troglodytarum TaxID=320322 RepID=A0A9E7JEU3_9LILI|nr:membrane steroid-binding protein [Musa troglodytarum]URD78510.1 membrane steroid-binding protein [Musa troglodytarum]URD78511.1 membrane steroid-binding protein [Musa troglodytarum]